MKTLIVKRIKIITITVNENYSTIINVGEKLLVKNKNFRPNVST